MLRFTKCQTLLASQKVIISLILNSSSTAALGEDIWVKDRMKVLAHIKKFNSQVLGKKKKLKWLRLLFLVSKVTSQRWPGRRWGCLSRSVANGWEEWFCAC